jgi:hypothetical protein
MTQRNVLPIASFVEGMQRPIELPHVETFREPPAANRWSCNAMKRLPFRRRATLHGVRWQLLPHRKNKTITERPGRSKLTFGPFSATMDAGTACGAAP